MAVEKLIWYKGIKLLFVIFLNTSMDHVPAPCPEGRMGCAVMHYRAQNYHTIQLYKNDSLAFENKEVTDVLAEVEKHTVASQRIIDQYKEPTLAERLTKEGFIPTHRPKPVVEKKEVERGTSRLYFGESYFELDAVTKPITIDTAIITSPTTENRRIYLKPGTGRIYLKP